jgi:polar amino acid transport system permease protein
MTNVVDIIFQILKGSELTLGLYVVTIVISIPLGFVCALLKISKWRLIRYSINFYTWIFRGTPLLLQLLFIYYGLAMVNIPIPFTDYVVNLGMSAFFAAVFTFSLNYGAYFTEIYRSGIESIEKGQYEAAKALNMNYLQSMRRIIIPQVIKRTIPPTCNEAINLVKDTALVIVIGLGDISQTAKEVFSREFSLLPFVIAAVAYLIISSVVVVIFKRVEKRYSVFE